MNTIIRLTIEIQIALNFFSQMIFMPDGMSQSLGGDKLASSSITFVSAVDALAYSNSAKLVRGQDGNIHIVFHDQGEIFYSVSNNRGSLMFSLETYVYSNIIVVLAGPYRKI